jgi:hypothetical protein
MRLRSLAIALLIATSLAILPCAGTERSATAQQQSDRLLKHGQESGSQGVGRRVALVIGNGAYENASPLKNPPNDARDMSATLKELGFDVTSDTNVSQREMKRLIREFGQKLRTGGVGLFYYAGHGVQSNGRNYLIPVEADIQSEAEVEDASVDVNLVLKYMDEAQNDLNIVILDACRNNPFARSFRSAGSGLAPVDAPTGTVIGYATAPGRVASDGPGRNGLYTSELLKQMRVPGLSVSEMFMRVRAEVMRQTGSKQVPWEASSLVGAFYFSAPMANGAANTIGALPGGTVPAAKVVGVVPSKRGGKAGKVLFNYNVYKENHSDATMRDFFGISGEFNNPFISSLERAGLTVIRYNDLAERDRKQVLGINNALLRGEKALGLSLPTGVSVNISIGINDMPQYEKMHIAVCKITLRLIDLEAGRVVTDEQVGDAKGFGNDQEQSRRNCLREAGNLVPQTFIDRVVKESAW